MKLQLIGILLLVLTSRAGAQNKPNLTQEQAIAAIRKMHGGVTVDKKISGKPVINVNLDQCNVLDDGLAQLKGPRELRKLDLGLTSISDAGESTGYL